MTRKTKLIASALVAGLALLAAGTGIDALTAGGVDRVEERRRRTSTEAVGARLVAADSHVLGKPSDSGTTLVAFLDFESEESADAYAAVEDLRQQYVGRLTVVVRYFPLPVRGHANALRAAKAVEAASEQGQFDAMYHHMFGSRKEWADRRKPMSDLFLSYAQDIGLDLVRFHRSYISPATARRVSADIADARALGVDRTPAFFVNQRQIRPRSYQDLTAAIEAALPA